MMHSSFGLPDALERAATELPDMADVIRPANGDPVQLIAGLGPVSGTRVLEWLLQHELDAGEELAQAWAETPGTSSEAVLQVSDGALSKAGRKVLRRIRHRLRSTGVEVPEAKTEPVVSRLPSVEPTLDEAMISPLDPSGTRVVYLVEANPAGGARMFEAMLSEHRGLLSFEVYSASRGKLKRFLKDSSRRERFSGVAAPPESVRSLVLRAAGRQVENRPLPAAYGQWRNRFAEASDVPSPGALVRDELGSADVEAGEAVFELVRRRELGPWLPEPEMLQEIAQSLDNLSQSSLVVSPRQKREQADEIVERGVAELAKSGFAGSTAWSFDESAYVFWKQERDSEARACLWAADAVREGGNDSKRLLRALLDVVLGPLVVRFTVEPAPNERPDDEGSLIVKP